MWNVKGEKTKIFSLRNCSDRNVKNEIQKSTSREATDGKSGVQ